VFDSIIDPTVSQANATEYDRLALAARPERLSGLRLGLLANTKRNAEQFLDEVGQLLAGQYGVQVVLAMKKPDITSTAPELTLAELSAECDVVVTGVGDCGSCSASAVADGILLEQAGTPAVALISEAFAVSADAMAVLRGASGYKYVKVPHPVASLTQDGVRSRAAQAVPAIVSLLTEPAMAVSA
jgi:hypothetical protein